MLERVERDAAYVGRLRLDQVEQRSTRGRVLDYVAGVTRWRRWLDFLIDAFYRGRPGEMQLSVRLILRLGLYELLIREAPPHATVDEAVRLARRRVGQRVTGLVNGLLRQVDRRRRDLPQPNSGDRAEDLAIRHSHPTWMVRRWLDRWGEEDVVRLLEHNNARPVFGIRINTLKLSAEEGRRLLDEAGVEWEPGILDTFVRVKRVRDFHAQGWFEQGLFSVQDEAAARVVHVLGPRPGERVLDLCAAPGGKALYAAELMQNRGLVLARDRHAGRLKLVEQGAHRQGAAVVCAAQGDGRSLDLEPEEIFDRVLVDAPCTGTGVLAKRADARWQRDPSDLAGLCRLQDALLKSASRAVRPGGRLVYATCSLEREENEDRVVAFLAGHPEYEVESCASAVPEGTCTPEGFYRSLPHRHAGDGAFAARLLRRA